MHVLCCSRSALVSNNLATPLLDSQSSQSERLEGPTLLG